MDVNWEKILKTRCGIDINLLKVLNIYFCTIFGGFFPEINDKKIEFSRGMS